MTKTPFRISFCGGGTDIPSFYQKYGGCVVSSTIDKYVYITMIKSFYSSIILKYSEVENVTNVDEIKHSIFKEILRGNGIKGVEINSTSDIPAGTGLGSSSAFTVGLLNAVKAYNGQSAFKKMLAEEACDVEIQKLKAPIGKQDQYASAFGGLNYIKFNRDSSVDVEPIPLSLEDKKRMFDNLLMFYVGGTRSASKVIEGYNNVESLKSLSRLAEKLNNNLKSGDIQSLGKILDEGWRIKKSVSGDISNEQIDEIYDIAINNGASGGKLLGAGSKGFMLFYAEKDCHDSIRKALSSYRELKFTFDNDGSQVVYNDTI